MKLSACRMRRFAKRDLVFRQSPGAFGALLRLLLCLQLTTLPVVVGGDYDDDGYDDDTGEYTGGSGQNQDSDADGLTDEEEWSGFEVLVAYEFSDYDEASGEEYYYTDYFPEWIFTDPYDSDSDNDLLPDGWEILMGFHPLDPQDGNTDSDNDGLTYGREYVENTNPHNPDTDGDGLTDGHEVLISLSDPNDPSDPSPGDPPTNAPPDDGGDPSGDPEPEPTPDPTGEPEPTPVDPDDADADGISDA